MEAIFLVLDPEKAAGVRTPPPELAKLQITGDVVSPEGTEVTLTVELLPVVPPGSPAALPIRSLGPVKGSLAREDIYGDTD